MGTAEPHARNPSPPQQGGPPCSAPQQGRAVQQQACSAPQQGGAAQQQGAPAASKPPQHGMGRQQQAAKHSAGMSNSVWRNDDDQLEILIPLQADCLTRRLGGVSRGKRCNVLGGPERGR